MRPDYEVIQAKQPRLEADVRMIDGAGRQAIFLAMSEKPATTYIVSVFEKTHWRVLLNTRDREEAESLEWAMIQDGVKARIEEITPKVKR